MGVYFTKLFNNCIFDTDDMIVELKEDPKPVLNELFQEPIGKAVDIYETKGEDPYISIQIDDNFDEDVVFV